MKKQKKDRKRTEERQKKDGDAVLVKGFQIFLNRS